MGEGYTYIYIPVHFSKEINLWAILNNAERLDLAFELSNDVA